MQRTYVKTANHNICLVFTNKFFVVTNLFFLETLINMSQTNRVDQLKYIQESALKLFTKKNKDYGDSFASYGPVGVLVRMNDKIQRMLTVTNNGISMVKSETIRDTLIDIHNYSAMAIMTLDDLEREKGKTPPLLSI